MAKVQSILSLHAQGWPQRRIARELGVDRETVRKYVEQRFCEAKPANAPTGSAGSKPAILAGLPAADPKPANAPIGVPADPAVPKPANAPTGSGFSPGPPSQCKPYHDQIVAKMAAGLSATRIHQDLAEEGATVHYDAVRRYVRRLGRVRALPFRRLECAAGEEAQVDFGSGAPVVGTDGKRRKTHVFRIVLSHSSQGVQRGDLHGRRRKTSWQLGKRLPALRRRAPDAGDRQPQGGRRSIPTGSIPN